MDFLLDGLKEAWRLLVRGDPEVLHAIGVSVFCTFTAVALAALAAFPYGAWLGAHRREGRGLQVFLVRVGMFTPTVVVGLLVFAFVSRRGLLGDLDLIYTKTAIVIGEFLLAFPLLVSLTHGATSTLDARVAETARTLGAGRLRTLFVVLGEVRVALVAACLAGLARCFSELGVALTVGGGIRMHTRTLASSITFELSRGDFGRALAPGIILLILAGGAALLAHRLGRETQS